MSKPTPTAEIVIRILSNGVLVIHVYPHDAIQWVESEAKGFGNFSNPEISDAYWLHVSPAFDPAEVKEYLLSYVLWSDVQCIRCEEFALSEIDMSYTGGSGEPVCNRCMEIENGEGK